MSRWCGSERAISPIVGAVLMLAILVALGSIAAVILFGLNETAEPRPDTVLRVESTDDASEHRLVHDGGDTLNGDRLTLQGAADPDAAAGKRLTDGDTVSFYPVDDEIQILWESSDGTGGETNRNQTYVLTTATVEQGLPAPDKGCDWVDNETDGGTDPAKVDDIVVNCDISTEEQIEIQNGGVIVGDATSDLKELDGDDATVYGDVAVEKVLNMQDGTITGEAISDTADVKVGNTTIEGPVEAEKVAEVTDGSVVEGDMESHAKDTKILGNSVVEGSVTAGGVVKLQDSEVEGDVYADPSDFDCTNSVINGQDCAAYTPKDPSDW